MRKFLLLLGLLCFTFLLTSSARIESRREANAKIILEREKEFFYRKNNFQQKYNSVVVSNKENTFGIPQKYYLEILEVNKETQIPLEIIARLIKIESGFEEKRIGTNKNGTKDYGLFQLNSKDLDWYSWKFNNSQKYDPLFYKDNIKIGMRYLRWLKNHKKTWDIALVCYNWGWGNYDRYLKGEKEIPNKTLEYVNYILKDFQITVKRKV